MNSEEARQILEVCRPGGADADSPRFREAMEQMQRDPELARWYAEQRFFDAALAESIRSVPVPLDLRASIMARRNVVRVPAAWWRPAWNNRHVRAAVAAAIVLAASMAGMFLSERGPTKFSDFRKELIKDGWAGQSHLAFRSTDIVRVKQWLARNGGPTAFRLPAEFQQHRLHGCSMAHVGGHPVAVLCLADGSKHLHLFVAEDVQFADLPRDGVPDFERCGLWKTAAWRNGDRTFVLTGMNYQTFVNTFRKDGRWTMSG